jgi:Opioid growth factor receptor (OGFr) conserved region
MLIESTLSVTESQDRALKFLVGKSKDHKNRTVDDYLKFDEYIMENDHEWIQWAFPIDTASEHNQYAGRLPYNVGGFFKYKSVRRVKQLELLEMYLSSIGVGMDKGGYGYHSLDINKFSTVVSSPTNHHMKRISRVLKHLRLTDDFVSMKALHRALTKTTMQIPMYFHPATVAYWGAIVLNFEYDIKDLI